MKCFRIALVAIGLFATFGFYPITLLWPSGFAWHGSGRSEYLEMILAIYATLGVFLILAARNPEEHRSLISFTIWSSIVHGGVMAVQALQDPHHRSHLWGDVPALFAVAGVLAVLRPKPRGTL